MQLFEAIAGQSIYDVCLQTYGTLDFFYKLLQDSNVLNADAAVVSGQKFLWDDTLVQNQQVNNAFAASGIYYSTDIGQPALTILDAILTEDGFNIIQETGETIIEE